ncbi:MAG: nucleotidyltransferase domain-containing protein, partial [Ignavibacteriaceae bacterium]
MYDLEKIDLMNKNNLIEAIKNHLLKNNEIEFAYLFGSYSIDKETPLSDIDIAVYFSKEIELLELGYLIAILEQITERKI